eukprot:gene5816-7015_t
MSGTNIYTYNPSAGIYKGTPQTNSEYQAAAELPYLGYGAPSGAQYMQHGQQYTAAVGSSGVYAGPPMLRLFGRILKLGTQLHRPGTLEQQFRAQARGQLLLNGIMHAGGMPELGRAHAHIPSVRAADGVNAIGIMHAGGVPELGGALPHIPSARAADGGNAADGLGEVRTNTSSAHSADSMRGNAAEVDVEDASAVRSSELGNATSGVFMVSASVASEISEGMADLTQTISDAVVAKLQQLQSENTGGEPSAEESPGQTPGAAQRSQSITAEIARVEEARRKSSEGLTMEEAIKLGFLTVEFPPMKDDMSKPQGLSMEL